jgi:hypothetical protein
MKILKLTLQKQPFEVMVTGEKTSEFRRPSYWLMNRLVDKNGNKKHYDYVEFINGYFLGKKLHLLTNSYDFLMNSDTGKWATVIEEKKPTFISADGAEMFEGDLYYVPQINNKNELLGTYLQFTTNSVTRPSDTKFSTEALAKKYIEENTPKQPAIEVFEWNKVWGVAIQASGNDKLIKEKKPYRQHTFETIERVTGFIPLQSEIDEIQDAILKDMDENKPLLTTHDGVEVFDKEADIYGINPINFEKHNMYASHEIYCDGLVFFSTPEKAQEYIDNNEKRYSLNDIRSAYNTFPYGWDIDIIFKKLKKLNKK